MASRFRAPYYTAISSLYRPIHQTRNWAKNKAVDGPKQTRVAATSARPVQQSGVIRSMQFALLLRPGRVKKLDQKSPVAIADVVNVQELREVCYSRNRRRQKCKTSYPRRLSMATQWYIRGWQDWVLRYGSLLVSQIERCKTKKHHLVSQSLRIHRGLSYDGRTSAGVSKGAGACVP